MNCPSISIMARILLISAGVLTVVFLICGIAQAFITHTGHEKDQMRPDIIDNSFTYNGNVPAKVTNVVGLGKSMASSASLISRNKEQTFGLQEKAMGENRKQASPLTGQQLQLGLTDMSKVSSRSRKVQKTITPSRHKTMRTRLSGSPNGAPSRRISKQRKAPKSETEILFRKLANEILTKLFEKFMLKAASVKSPVGPSNNITTPLRGRGGSGVIVQAGVAGTGINRSPPRRLSKPKKPNISQSPPFQSTVNHRELSTPRPRDGFVQSNRMRTQVQPFELFEWPVMPMLPPMVGSMPTLGRQTQNPRAPNTTTSPFDFFRQYYQRQMQFERLEERFET